MKKYIILTACVALFAIGSIVVRPALASMGVVEWPKTCQLENGMYTEEGYWVSSSGKVYALGSLDSALKCVMKASLPKVVFDRLGKYGDQAVKDLIGDKPYTQIDSMQKDAAREE
jgi:hypothetical protein